MRTMWLTLLMLMGCTDGPNPETLITDVRVVAIVVEPPVVAPGESVEIATLVADPKQRGVTTTGWACGEQCDVASDLPEDGWFVRSFTPDAPLSYWALACETGRCEAPTEAELRSPVDWMGGLPQNAASLARRTVPVVADVEAANPVIEDAPPEVVAEPEAEVPLLFRVPGAEQAWGYSTAGGFARPVEDVADAGDAELTWYAPKDETTADLYVVFEDREGGTAVWQGSWTAP